MSSSSAKKQRSSRLFGPAISDILSTSKRKRKTATDDDGEPRDNSAAAKRKRANEPKKLSAEAAALLGEAHDDVVGGRDERAIRLLGEVVRLAPECPDAYATLSSIYESRGSSSLTSTSKQRRADMQRANQLALVAAHLAPRDATSWRRVAELSLELASRADDEDGGGRAARSLDEATALDALGKLLELDPCDAAAAADRAALHAATGSPRDAADELQAFVARRAALATASNEQRSLTPEDIALELVLAENAKLVGRRDVARSALRRALDETARSTDEDDDARRSASLRETQSRAGVELALLEYEDGDSKAALAVLDREMAVLKREDGETVEPLDVLTLRGSCEARLGRDALAAEAWWPLVQNARKLAQAIATSSDDDDDVLPEELFEGYEEHVRMLELLVGVVVDLPKNDLDSVVSAALDVLARLHAAKGDKRAEADSHARLGQLQRKAGKPFVAKQRLDRALAASPCHATALLELASMHQGEDGDLDKIVAAFDILSSEKQLTDRTQDLDEELRAWATMCETFEAMLLTKEDPKKRKRIALRMGAVALGIVATSSTTEHSVKALGDAALDILLLNQQQQQKRTAASSDEQPGSLLLSFEAARKVFDVRRCSHTDLRAMKRAERVAMKASIAERKKAQGRLLPRCIGALKALEMNDAVTATLQDVERMLDSAPCRETHAFGGGAPPAEESEEEVVRALASAASALATDPENPRRASAFSRALHACSRPSAGIEAIAKARTVTAALQVCAKDDSFAIALRRRAAAAAAEDEQLEKPAPSVDTQQQHQLSVIVAAHHLDPRRALSALAPKVGCGDLTTSGAPLLSLQRAATLADCTSRPTRAQGAVLAAGGSRHMAVLGAMAQLAAYSSGKKQRSAHEVAYNHARCLDAFGLPHLAAPKYLECLRLVPKNLNVDDSLARYAAHNLDQIYNREASISRGAKKPPKDARKLIDRFLTI